MMPADSPRRWTLGRFSIGSEDGCRSDRWVVLPFVSDTTILERVTVVELPDDCVIVRRDDLDYAVTALAAPLTPLGRERRNRLREALDA